MLVTFCPDNCHSPFAQIDLSNNGLAWDGRLHKEMSGVKAIAEAMAVSSSLTAADLRYNQLGSEAKQVLRDCVKDRASFDLKLARQL